MKGVDWVRGLSWRHIRPLDCLKGVDAHTHFSNDLKCFSVVQMVFLRLNPSGPGRSLVHCFQNKIEQVQLPWKVQLMHAPAAA